MAYHEAELSVEELGVLIAQLYSKAEFGGLHERVGNRKKHYHNVAGEGPGGADPPLPAPFKDAQRYQSDFIRQQFVRLNARLSENDWVPHCKPLEVNEKTKKAADQWEKYLRLGFDQLREEDGLDLQGGLTEGLGLWVYGIAHCYKRVDKIAGLPDYEYSDEEDVGKAIEEGKPSRFKVNESEEEEEKGKGKYRETDVARLERYKRLKAKAGFPWRVEIIDPETFVKTEDKDGLATCIVKKVVRFITYQRALAEEDIKLYSESSGRLLWKKDTLIVKAGEQPVGEATDVAATSGPGEKRYLVVAQVWTREWCYELARFGTAGSNESSAGEGWTLVKSFKHHYRINGKPTPPFSIAYASRYTSGDPQYMYEPAFAGSFRLKPSVDRQRTYEDHLVEMTALPTLFLTKPDGTPEVDTAGHLRFYTQQEIEMIVLPDGSRVQIVAPQPSEALHRSVERTMEDMKEAAPDVGIVDIGTTTQSWTARQMTQQANVYPASLLGNLAEAIQRLVRIITDTHSRPLDDGGFGEGVYLYSRKDDKLVGVEPEDIEGLLVYVDIPTKSAAEIITRQVHGVELSKPGPDGRPFISSRELYEDYFNKPDAAEVILEIEQEMAFRKYAPLVIDQMVAARLGVHLVMGSQLQPVGLGGQPATPEQAAEIIAERARQRGQPPPPPGSVTAVQQGAMPPEAATMGAMPPLNAPGTEPLGGPPL